MAGNSCSPIASTLSLRSIVSSSSPCSSMFSPTQLHHGRAGLREPAADLDEHRLPQVLCEWQHQRQTTDTQWCLRRQNLTLYYWWRKMLPCRKLLVTKSVQWRLFVARSQWQSLSIDACDILFLIYALTKTWMSIKYPSPFQWWKSKDHKPC